MRDTERARTVEPVRVFVSNTPSDPLIARKLRDLLRRAGARIFTSEDLNAGAKWQAQLRKEMVAADVVVAVLSGSALESDWVMQEMGAAWALEKPILPVVHERQDLRSFPIDLRAVPAFRLRDLEKPAGGDKFVQLFESNLAAAHAA